MVQCKNALPVAACRPTCLSIEFDNVPSYLLEFLNIQRRLNNVVDVFSSLQTLTLQVDIWEQHPVEQCEAPALAITSSPVLQAVSLYIATCRNLRNHMRSSANSSWGEY